MGWVRPRGVEGEGSEELDSGRLDDADVEVVDEVACRQTPR